MSDSFADYLHELFAGLGPVSLRKLFGGQGVYYDGIIVGLVAGEDLFLKTDATTVNDFETAGGRPFVYHGKDKSVAMSYWSPPAEAMESSEAMQPWARLAYVAAMRSHASKPARRKAKKTATPKLADKRAGLLKPPGV